MKKTFYSLILVILCLIVLKIPVVSATGKVLLCSDIQTNAQISPTPKDSQERQNEKKLKRKQKRELRRNMDGEIQLSGSFALYPMVVKWAAEFRKIYPRVKVDISAGGAGKGITDALCGVVDMGMISRNINKAESEKGAVAITVARDAVVATINSRNPNIIKIKTQGLKPSTAKKLWKYGNLKTWGEVVNNGNSEAVHLYTRSDASGASERWAQWLGTKAEALKGTAVYSDPGMASVVQRDKLSLAYCSVAYAYNLRNGKPHRGITVVPIDFNEDSLIDLDEDFYGSLSELSCAIEEGEYPSRELYIVCKGMPKSPCVKAFLEYILTDGQEFARQSGYAPLSEEEAERELMEYNLDSF